MALYRKYRPATFAEIVGQEHVTEPLSAALEAGRINHAYLFSGPRGCGKTSSARILARSLNCVQGPTASPCGVCNSCVALGPGGSGNLDVMELDAASHGGVEDTRDLRDKAFYAPAESRYRVFIVDEAHMVTNAGFNSLLKIVEEPPEHLIFIFATTEPEKVLPTIRSRTHHYPFRLLPPTVMRGLLDNICEQEHVAVEDAVFPLVIRAGGGSPRDSLSVLDQLLAGAGPEGITYPRALSLLGVTDVALIDDTVDALAANDGAALFETVNRLVEAGHDPRRFASDLLERFRDLILMQAVPDAGERGLVDAPVDVLARMRAEVDRIGPATLTRYAEIVHDGLGEMRGATAPRLLLEVMCARMLLPGAAEGQAALMQRLERLERGISAGLVSAPAAGFQAAGSQAADTAPEVEPAFVRPSQRAAQVAEPAPIAVPEPVVPVVSAAEPVVPVVAVPAPVPVVEPVVSEPVVAEPMAGPDGPAEPSPVPEAVAPVSPAPEPEPVAVPELAAAVDSGRPDAVAVRAAWPEVIKKVRDSSRTLEVMLSGATVRRVDGEVIAMSHPAPPLAARLAEQHHAEVIEQAMAEVFKCSWKLVIEKDSGPAPAGGPPPLTRAAQAAPPKVSTGFKRPSQSPNYQPAEPAEPLTAAPVQRAEARTTPPVVITRPSQEGLAPAAQSAASDYPDDLPPEPDLPEDHFDASTEDEMLDEAAAGPGEQLERRDPEIVAIELLEAELGAVRLEE
ncbi:DNA polymerase III subunit gamma and tau [Tomitella biformata]|uniref:DNA polymerase III subunit gamma and tau n=1 Tax=Tomitella biformata TaxID=630403 RepID=UPI0004656BDA|nr:DNA polymerase III subunit gamma and tau [Tomitella biformata]